MYTTSYEASAPVQWRPPKTLGETAEQLEERRLFVLRQVRALNQSVAATIRMPVSPEQVFQLQTLLARLRERRAELAALTTAVNRNDLTEADRIILSTGAYIQQSSNALKQMAEGAAQVARDVAIGVAKTAGEAAGAATVPLILPVLAIGAALFLVGKGGIGRNIKVL
jgi:hypothetical protein